MLVMLAWLQRFGNGQGGLIDREVGVGTRRIDVLLRWPYRAPDGGVLWQREAFELKVWRDRDKKRDPVTAGLAQLDLYLERLGLEHGVLAVFDARAQALPIEDRTAIEPALTPAGRRVTLLRG